MFKSLDSIASEVGIFMYLTISKFKQVLRSWKGLVYNTGYIYIYIYIYFGFNVIFCRKCFQWMDCKRVMSLSYFRCSKLRQSDNYFAAWKKQIYIFSQTRNSHLLKLYKGSPFWFCNNQLCILRRINVNICTLIFHISTFVCIYKEKDITYFVGIFDENKLSKKHNFIYHGIGKQIQKVWMYTEAF